MLEQNRSFVILKVCKAAFILKFISFSGASAVQCVGLFVFANILGGLVNLKILRMLVSFSQ